MSKTGWIHIEIFITQWFSRTPDWVITITSVVFIILFIIISTMVFLAVKRYSDAIGRENKLITLQEEVSSLRIDNNIHKSKSMQFQNVAINARSFINSLNRVVEEKSDHLPISLIQRIVEALASDVKSSGSESHRCGFWLLQEEEGNLKLINGSSGFPDTYISQRTLGINESVAGRCFRKRQPLNLADVSTDSDWSSEDSSGTYNALICIPVDSFGVLTIDAKKPMDESVQLIGELYAIIIEGTFNEMLRNIPVNAYDEYDEVASGVE